MAVGVFQAGRTTIVGIGIAGLSGSKTGTTGAGVTVALIGTTLVIGRTIVTLGHAFHFARAFSLDTAQGTAFEGSLAAIAIGDTGALSRGADVAVAVAGATHGVGRTGLAIGFTEFRVAAYVVFVAEEIVAALRGVLTMVSGGCADPVVVPTGGIGVEVDVVSDLGITFAEVVDTAGLILATTAHGDGEEETEE